MYSAPFSFYKDGQPVGIDVELFSAVAEQQKIRFEFVECTFPEIFTQLDKGEIDGIMDAITITDERAARYDFSAPYCTADIVLAVAKTDTAIYTYEDLRGKAVAVLSGTTWQDYAESIRDQYGFTLLHCPNMQRVYSAVTTGETAACFDDSPEMKYQIAIGLPMRIVGGMGHSAGLGFLVKKDTLGTLLKQFDEGLRQLRANGRYDQIMESYFGSESTFNQ